MPSDQILYETQILLDQAGRTADNVDRVAPTRRPNGRPVMRQQWRDLLFLHWKVPVAMLRPLVPAALEIDTFEGEAYIGLVPFTMRNVRPVWSPPFPLLSNFHEVNVRTYVYHRGCNPGVWFFSLDAANRIAVQIARILWRLPYYFASIELTKSASEAGQSQIQYNSHRRFPQPVPAVCAIDYTTIGTPLPAPVGTLEHFLAERYLLYAARSERLFCGQVHHLPYPLQTAEIHSLTETLVFASGIRPPAVPPIVHYASGVDVEIFPLQQIGMEEKKEL